MEPLPLHTGRIIQSTLRRRCSSVISRMHEDPTGLVLEKKKKQELKKGIFFEVYDIRRKATTWRSIS